MFIKGKGSVIFEIFKIDKIMPKSMFLESLKIGSVSNFTMFLNTCLEFNNL